MVDAEYARVQRHHRFRAAQLQLAESVRFSNPTMEALQAVQMLWHSKFSRIALLDLPATNSPRYRDEINRMSSNPNTHGWPCVTIGFVLKQCEASLSAAAQALLPPGRDRT